MANRLEELRLLVGFCQRNSNASKLAILYTQSSNGLLASNANNFQVGDNHGKHLHKRSVTVSQIVLSIVRRRNPAAILEERNDCGCSNETSSNFAIYKVKPLSHGLGQRKSKALDLREDVSAELFIPNEMNLTQPTTIQMLQQRGCFVLIDRNLAGDLDEHQQLLGLGPEFLPLDLVQRDIGRQRCGSVGRFSQPVGDHPENHRCYDRRKSCTGSPSIPFGNTVLAKPPAIAQSVEKLHFLPLMLSGPHSATCPQGVEPAHG